jgi:hypothetical protein
MSNDLDLMQLADTELWNKINMLYQTKGGVYKIIAYKDGQRILIDRFLGQDQSGTLYIGKANSYLNRVIHLKTSILSFYNSSSHICGRRYKANPNIAVKFPEEVLFIELIPTASPAELERVLIIEYATKFGEVPPLNAV